VRIRCPWNVFTERLPSNGRLFWLHYSGFQVLEGTHRWQGDLISFILSYEIKERLKLSILQEMLEILFIVTVTEGKNRNAQRSLKNNGIKSVLCVNILLQNPSDALYRRPCFRVLSVKFYLYPPPHPQEIQRVNVNS
jgi:hypothetical protein